MRSETNTNALIHTFFRSKQAVSKQGLHMKKHAVHVKDALACAGDNHQGSDVKRKADTATRSTTSGTCTALYEETSGSVADTDKVGRRRL